MEKQNNASSSKLIAFMTINYRPCISYLYAMFAFFLPTHSFLSALSPHFRNLGFEVIFFLRLYPKQMETQLLLCFVPVQILSR